MTWFIVTLLHTNETTSIKKVQSRASKWFVLQSCVAHLTNIKSATIIDDTLNNAKEGHSPVESGNQER